MDGGLLDDLKDNAWIALILLVVVAAFKNALTSLASKVLHAVGDALYQRLAGSRLLRRRALARYRRELTATLEQIRVPFRPNQPLILSDSYVPLKVATKEGRQPVAAWEVLQKDVRAVVVGPPGAGKSILLRHLAAHGLALQASDVRVPVFIELHRLARGDGLDKSVEDHIVQSFERYGFPKADRFAAAALERGGLMLLFDGLDEMSADQRREVAAQLSDFLMRKRSCPTIVTCRNAVYRGELDEVTERIEIEPFEDQQIQDFLGAWREAMPPGKSPGQLMASLRQQPKLLAAARNPLLLTIIAHLYSDNPTYALPRSRADFYSQAASILLGQWQGHLGQNRFEAPEKATVLSRLALEMQSPGEDDGERDRRTISRERAIAVATSVMPSLGRDNSDVGEIVQEIVERSGLLVPIDGGARYTFAHLTFQEYFAAEALRDRSVKLLEHFAEDHDAWREVVVLWCGLAAESTEMIERVWELDDEVALACVAEAGAVDLATADRVLDPVLDNVIAGKTDERAQRALGAVAADIRPRGERVLRALVEALSEPLTLDGKASVAVALSASNRMQAAEALVPHLGDGERTMAAVIRMGDVAVPSLETAKAEGRHPERVETGICACLAGIGTPDAARALAKIMLRGGEADNAAAWGVASLLSNPLAREALANVPVPQTARVGKASLEWIWQPFAMQDDGSLQWIVGRVAALIAETGNPAEMVATPDPRIAAALCAMDPSPLDSGLGDGTAREKLAKAANAASVEVEFESSEDGDGSYLVARGEGPGRLFGSPELLRHGALPKVKTLRELLACVVYSRRQIWFNRHEESTDPRAMNEFLDRLLDAVDGHVLWTRLMRSMPAGLRYELLGRLFGLVAFKPENWSSVRARAPFQFERSLPYLALLGIVLALSALAVRGGFQFIGEQGGLGSVLSFVALAIVLLVVWGWFRMLFESFPSDAFGWIDLYELNAVLLGPILTLERVIRRPRLISVEPGLIATAGFLPGGMWLAIYSLSTMISMTTAVLTLMALLASTWAVAYIGVRRERAMATPLVGLFLENTAADEVTT